MFAIAAETQAYWKRKGTEPYSDEDIRFLQSRFRYPIPRMFLDFARQYGKVRFDSLDTPCAFSYAYEEQGFTQKFQGAISQIKSAERMVSYYEGLIQDPGTDEFPKIPDFFLPIGLDFGQSEILLETGGDHQRIWFWEFQFDRWGTGGNTRLGYVAEDLEAFFRNLQWVEE